MVTAKQQIGEWVVKMEWPDGVNSDGPARMVIEPVGKPPVGGISSTVLRQINFRAARDSLLSDTKKTRATAAAMRELERNTLLSALDKGASTDDYLALLAHVYIMRTGTIRKPVDSLAEDLGRSPATVKGHLWQAQNRGLLQNRVAGRKGGNLSAEAENIVIPYMQSWSAELQKVTTSRSKT